MFIGLSVFIGLFVSLAQFSVAPGLYPTLLALHLFPLISGTGLKCVFRIKTCSYTGPSMINQIFLMNMIHFMPLTTLKREIMLHYFHSASAVFPHDLSQMIDFPTFSHSWKCGKRMNKRKNIKCMASLNYILYITICLELSFSVMIPEND